MSPADGRAFCSADVVDAVDSVDCCYLFSYCSCCRQHPCLPCCYAVCSACCCVYG